MCETTRRKQQRETSEQPFEKNKTSPIAENFMIAPSIFSGENYQIWSVKMKSYLEASGFCDV